MKYVGKFGRILVQKITEKFGAFLEKFEILYKVTIAVIFKYFLKLFRNFENISDE